MEGGGGSVVRKQLRPPFYTWLLVAAWNDDDDFGIDANHGFTHGFVAGREKDMNQETGKPC